MDWSSWFLFARAVQNCATGGQTDRDMYLVHENNKAMESVSRWVCQFCGKGFTAEHFLDRHFQNRHPEHVRQGREIVCLSDYCDIFRCDVIGTKNKVDFWQVALCIEDDLIDLRRKCEVTMDLCIPTLLSQNTSHALRDLLYQGVCSYLTCHTYWDTPFPEESQTAQILYVMACVFVLFVFIMYYCVVLNYYYSDDWDSPHDQWNEVTSDQMLWRPRSQYDPALAAQQRPRITATRRKAQHCPSPS
ncbi:uncharacterized protein LOC135475395 isoform X2 [Liolophura sinensis]|uniref:uncharacterized protein LOC135475395 isoform X2 n=1 Tax=Liolophura sinensis TaxID=3198878 RepID=UPI0031598CDC